MVDKIELLAAFASSAQFDAVSAAKLHTQLTQSLALTLACTPLGAIQSAPEPIKQEVEFALKDLLSRADLVAISKRWEPIRKPENTETKTELANALNSLVYARRPPYEPLSIDLSDALKAKEAQLEAIQEYIKILAPKTDLKKLSGKWDKHYKAPASATAADFRKRLLELLSEHRQPEPKPPPKARQQTSVKGGG